MAEYGLLLVLVVLGAMAIMLTFGDTLAETFGFAAETFNESPALAQEAIEKPESGRAFMAVMAESHIQEGTTGAAGEEAAE